MDQKLAIEATLKVLWTATITNKAQDTEAVAVPIVFAVPEVSTVPEVFAIPEVSAPDVVFWDFVGSEVDGTTGFQTAQEVPLELDHFWQFCTEQLMTVSLTCLWIWVW